MNDLVMVIFNKANKKAKARHLSFSKY
jgi:hypothetical protein